MSVEDRVMALLDEGNPIPDPADLDRDHLDAAAYLETLETLEERIGDMTQIDTMTRGDTKTGSARPRWLAAALVTVLIGTAAFLISQIDDFGPDSAFAAGTEFINAFNAGDADALLATLTSDAELLESYSPGTGEFEAIERTFFEQHMVWATAQGSMLTTPECVVTEESVTQTAVSVVCEFGWLYAPEKAAGLAPVPTVLTMVVTPDGVSQAAFEYPPEFTPDAFSQWLFRNHRDDHIRIEYGEWSSLAEAEQDGLLRAQYAEEWAATLEIDQ